MMSGEGSGAERRVSIGFYAFLGPVDWEIWTLCTCREHKIDAGVLVRGRAIIRYRNIVTNRWIIPHHMSHDAGCSRKCFLWDLDLNSTGRWAGPLLTLAALKMWESGWKSAKISDCCVGEILRLDCNALVDEGL